MTTKTFTKGGWRLELDSSEIFPSDPGQGTPAMVYNDAKKVSATYFCAIGTGEATGYGRNMDAVVEIPATIVTWLEGMEDLVETFIEENAPKA